MSKRELADERQVLGNFAKRLKQCREDAGLNKKELAKIAGVSIGNITRYEIADHGAGRDAIWRMAKYFNVAPLWLMGFDVPKHGGDGPGKVIPILGEVAAGVPIEAQENVINSISVLEDSKIDFGLLINGNSMVGAGINDGDIVLFRQQRELENGEIGIIDIDGEVTLKRFYRDNTKIMLLSENPSIPPHIMNGKECKEKGLRILGKAISLIREVK